MKEYVAAQVREGPAAPWGPWSWVSSRVGGSRAGPVSRATAHPGVGQGGYAMDSRSPGIWHLPGYSGGLRLGQDVGPAWWGHGRAGQGCGRWGPALLHCHWGSGWWPGGWNGVLGLREGEGSSRAWERMVWPGSALRALTVDTLEVLIIIRWKQNVLRKPHLANPQS